MVGRPPGRVTLIEENERRAVTDGAPDQLPLPVRRDDRFPDQVGGGGFFRILAEDEADAAPVVVEVLGEQRQDAARELLLQIIE